MRLTAFPSRWLSAGLLLLGALGQTQPVAAREPVNIAVNVAPALWQVKDADTTIYLFGTVHVLKPRMHWFDEGVREAFDASDEVVLEIAEPDPQAIAAVVDNFRQASATVNGVAEDVSRVAEIVTRAAE